MLQRFTLMRSVQTLLLAVTLAVFLAPLRAQELKDIGGAAKAITLVGDVSYLKDGPGSYKWALSQGQTIQQKWIIKTGRDGYALFQVCDGSTFEVFAESEVTFRQDSGDWTHLLNVWIGHVKVMIQHLPGVANPNNVTSPTAVISVRGTVFEVIVEDLAGTTFVSLDEGLIQVHHRLLGGSDKFLNPGESVRIFPNQPLAKAFGGGNIMLKAIKAAEQAIYEAVWQRGVGGNTGSAGGNSGGPQGDKDKNKGSGGGGVPVPPGAAPTPPPPPPGGGE